MLDVIDTMLPVTTWATTVDSCAVEHKRVFPNFFQEGYTIRSNII